ncbi:protein MONOCULM 1 [Brachypodium distachyon]|uniref:protein MONOCULM 1 n=1 Tax=Brachypodium distachyon TaxID=15368 RepID=UPI00071CE619|nr:protein MONOCULM 1 [Brachypodium distachyon]|eukprot:XP_003560591.2 protein MONOCULM 1 [Brachypodium distachyon]
MRALMPLLRLPHLRPLLTLLAAAAARRRQASGEDRRRRRSADVMLGSLHSSSSSSDTDTTTNNNNSGGVEAAAQGGIGHALQQAAAPPSARDLVLACADLLHRGDLAAARRAAEILLSTSSPRGDAADRLAYHFARALALRVDAMAGHVVPFASSSGSPRQSSGGPGASAGPYLAFNQIAPFLRFAHLTANQAILDSIPAGARRVHILDLDAAHGVQWPPLLQAIADRADPALGLGPPEVRITGAGADRDALLRTGNRLRAFARSIRLPFHFAPLLLSQSTKHQQEDSVAGSGSGSSHAGSGSSQQLVELHPDETLAVNCVLFLHKLGGQEELAAFLKWVKAMAPAVVTVAERESSHPTAIEHPAMAMGIDGREQDELLPRRVGAAMDHYAAVFEALEATVPPGSRERLAVEQDVLGREIEAAVSGVGGRWRGGLERWAAAARATGFAARPLSPFAVSQARLLLRLHYPSEGYLVQEARGACFLGWQTRPLLSVSSWH